MGTHLPIDSLSYSRMRLYLTSKVMFWRHYVTKDYHPSRSTTMVEGSALHRIVEQITVDAIKTTGGISLTPPTEETRQQLIDIIVEEYPTITHQNSTKVSPALMESHGMTVAENFVEHMNQYLKRHHLARFTHCEFPMKAFIKDSKGMSFPIPWVCRVDGITHEVDKDTGKPYIVIHDWKMVRSTSDATLERNTFMYQFQQLPYYLIAREEFPGVEIRVAYHFFKVTQSKTRPGKKGDPMVRTIIMTPPTDEDIQAFCFLTELMLQDMRGLEGPKTEHPILLPNVYDDMKGAANWRLFKEMYADHYL